MLGDMTNFVSLPLPATPQWVSGSSVTAEVVYLAAYCSQQQHVVRLRSYDTYTHYKHGVIQDCSLSVQVKAGKQARRSDWLTGCCGQDARLTFWARCKTHLLGLAP